LELAVDAQDVVRELDVDVALLDAGQIGLDDVGGVRLLDVDRGGPHRRGEREAREERGLEEPVHRRVELGELTERVEAGELGSGAPDCHGDSSFRSGSPLFGPGTKLSVIDSSLIPGQRGVHPFAGSYSPRPASCASSWAATTSGWKRSLGSKRTGTAYPARAISALTRTSSR